MVGMIGRRLAIALPVLLVSSFIMFAMVSLSGNPIARFLAAEPPPDANTIRLLEVEYGMTGSLMERYGRWLAGVLTLDFGKSNQNIDIGVSLVSSLGTTLLLVAGAIIVAAILAIIFGVVSGVRQMTALDTLLSGIVFFALATPIFWFAILLKDWGVTANETFGGDFFRTIGDGAGQPLSTRMGYLVLPVTVLVVNVFASWARYVRASVIDVMAMDYVDLARAKGLSEGQVIRKHVLRNSLIPFVTVAALDIGGLISGAVITETVFQWRGMGDLLLTGIAFTDANVVMAWLVVFATITIVLNLCADIVYGFLDPRVRRK